jgi:DNA polymerase III epsilon subunit family exonuclease
VRNHPLRDENLETLRARAHSYLRRVDRPLDTRELARKLFHGRYRSPAVSTVLIRTLLGRDERFFELDPGMWQLVQPIPLETPLAEVKFTVVDLEATGSNPRTDQIIEVGIVRIERLRIVSEYETLVRPSVPIPSWIRRLTGIDEDTVRHAPRFCEIADEVLEHLSGAAFVAHNVEFDAPFLFSQLGGEGYRPPPCPLLCTVRLARRFLPQVDSYRLDALASHFGIPLERHHRAVDDAMATAAIFLRLVQRLRTAGVVTLGDLMESEDLVEDADRVRDSG